VGVPGSDRAGDPGAGAHDVDVIEVVVRLDFLAPHFSRARRLETDKGLEVISRGFVIRIFRERLLIVLTRRRHVATLGRQRPEVAEHGGYGRAGGDLLEDLAARIELTGLREVD